MRILVSLFILPLSFPTCSLLLVFNQLAPHKFIRRYPLFIQVFVFVWSVSNYWKERNKGQEGGREGRKDRKKEGEGREEGGKRGAKEERRTAKLDVPKYYVYVFDIFLSEHPEKASVLKFICGFIWCQKEKRPKKKKKNVSEEYPAVPNVFKPDIKQIISMVDFSESWALGSEGSYTIEEHLNVNDTATPQSCLCLESSIG